MVSVVLGIGSNCGDREKLVKNTISWLSTILMQTVSSSVYETPDAVKTGKPYLNAVVKGFFEGNGIELEDLLKEKEHSMGRTAECRQKGDVPIDIDIVIMNDEVVKDWDFRQKFFQTGYKQITPNL